MTTAERTLRVLIHDIRTPIGVAQGYLRLIVGDRLPTPAERQRAFQVIQKALEQISRLGDDAAQLIEPPSPLGRVAVPSQRLVEHVCARLPEASVRVALTEVPERPIMLPADVDRVADAVAGVLLTGPVTAGGRTVTVGSTDAELWFASGAATGAADREPLDPWRTPGLTLPLACQTLGDAGGRWWTAPGKSGAGVAFPFEGGR